MSWADCLSMISEAISAAFGWLTDIVPAEFLGVLITVFGIYTASRLLLAPIVGSSGSDRAKRKDDE